MRIFLALLIVCWIRNLRSFTDAIGILISHCSIIASLERNNINNNNDNNGRTQGGPSNSRVPCTFCGMSSHTTHDCRTKQNEFTNHSDHPFIGSESHKRLVSLFGKRDPKFSDLQKLRRLASEPPSALSSTYAFKKLFVKKDWKNRNTLMTTILPMKLPVPIFPNLIP